MRTQRRYATLDTLRGVAALAVMVFHLGEVKLAPNIVPHGYLAVDLFFMLSGFVVAHAYEEALRGSLSFRSFALRRAIRLYPLAILGAMSGLSLLILKWRYFPEKVDPLPNILISGLLNGLLLPTPFGGEASNYELFPGNGPLWTLFFELAANLAWASWGPHLRIRTLLVVVAIAGLAIVALSWNAGTANLGFDLATAPGGAARVCFGFPLGVVLFRLLGDSAWTSRLRSDRTGPAIVGILLISILAMPQATSSSTFAAWDIVSILFLIPAIVASGISQCECGRFGDFIGELSYPIYVLHFPIILLASGLHQLMLAQVPVIAILAATIAVVIAAALFALRFYDLPVRSWLSQVSRQLVL